MSLVCWLPLDGDLHNQGCSNLNIALVSGNTWASSGKIGNSSLTLTKLQTILPNSSCMSGAKEISYCYWVKVNTAWSTNWLDGIRWIETDGSATSTARQEFYTNCTLIGTWYKGGSISGKSFTPGAWTHLAATINYNTGEAKFYINGILNGTTTNVDTTYYCRGDFYIGDNGVDICENDVRIYNHCLSAAEVHEISQGLMLHYKLDSILNNNMLKYIPRLYSPDAYNAYQFDLTENLVAGQTYTFQFWDVDVAHSGKTAKKLGISVYWGGGNINLKTMNGTSYFTNGHADHLQFTITITENLANGTGAGNAKINIYNSVSSAAGTLNMHIGAWKVEKGTAATAWGLTPEESESIIVDSSGYGHNGTIVRNLITEITTPRYSASTYFANSAAIKYTNFNLGNIWSAGVWFYSPSTVTTNWGCLFAVNSNGGDADFKMNLYIQQSSGKLQFTANGQYDSTQSFTKDTWHHLMETFDGSTVSCYLDGVLIKTKAITNAELSRSNLVIGARSSSANGSTATGYVTAYMSDFRIYCTALSAANVKQLYEIGAKVDNNNNIHTFELNETISKINQNVTCSTTISNPNVTIKTYKTASSPAPRTTNHSILSPSQLTETSLIPIQLGDKYFISINECTITPYTYNYQSSFWKRTGSSTYKKTTDPRRYGQYAREYIYIEYYDEEQNLLGQKFVKSTIKQTESTYNESYTPQQYPPVNCIASLPDTKFPEFSSAKYIKICIQKDGSTVANGNVTSIIKEVQPKIKLFKKGILQTRQFIENAQAKFYPLSSIEGNNLIEL